VLSFTNKIGDHPMLLADLKIFQSESDQFGAPQTASNEQRKDRPIAFASQAISSRFCKQGSGLFDAQPVSNPNTRAFCAFNATDSGCQFGTQESCVSCLVCESSHSC
jgi:hypothetical protein